MLAAALVRGSADLAMLLYATALAAWLWPRSRSGSTARPSPSQSSVLPASTDYDSTDPEQLDPALEGHRPRTIRWADGLWLAGAFVLVVHIALAYQFTHHGSHAAALEHTARVTRELIGRAYPEGLYWNFAFAGLWLCDALWLALAPLSHGRRPNWLHRLLHLFLAFIAIQATIPFAPPVTRLIFAPVWLGLATLLVVRSMPRPNKI